MTFCWIVIDFPKAEPIICSSYASDVSDASDHLFFARIGRTNSVLLVTDKCARWSVRATHIRRI